MRLKTDSCGNGLVFTTMQVAIFLYYHFLTGIYVRVNDSLDRIERLLLTQGLAQIRSVGVLYCLTPKHL